MICYIYCCFTHFAKYLYFERFCLFTGDYLCVNLFKLLMLYNNNICFCLFVLNVWWSGMLRIKSHLFCGIFRRKKATNVSRDRQFAKSNVKLALLSCVKNHLRIEMCFWMCCECIESILEIRIKLWKNEQN